MTNKNTQQTSNKKSSQTPSQSQRPNRQTEPSVNASRTNRDVGTEQKPKQRDNF
jgi:hypothetical protein